MGNKQQKPFNLISSINVFSKKHWLFKALITFLPTIWLPLIVKYFGHTLGLLQNDSSLTFWGGAVTVIIYLAGFAAILLSVLDSKDGESIQNLIRSLELTRRFLSNLLSSSHRISTEKNSILIDTIDFSLSQKNVAESFLLNIKPMQQLKNITNEICSCFFEQTSINKDKLLVTMAYSLPEYDAEWKWIDFQAAYGGLQLSVLTTDERTVFYRLMTRQIDSRFIYINDKAKAKAANEYVSDARDRKFKDEGSLVSTEISIETNNNTIARAILSVSSYGKKFTNDESEDGQKAVEENFKNIFIQFEEEIRSELSLLYFQIKYKAENKQLVEAGF